VVEHVARWSYAIYLTNLEIAAILFTHLALPPSDGRFGERAGWVVLFWSLTLAVSAALYRWLRIPRDGGAKNDWAPYRDFAAAARR